MLSGLEALIGNEKKKVAVPLGGESDPQHLPSGWGVTSYLGTVTLSNAELG
uniref:Uncharacterized protein n=1 Tax=Anguilla anguilla TaxID=7936 RepID=A0A0E9WDA6_ANGAN